MLAVTEVTLTAQPAKVILDERTPQGIGAERTSHVDGQPVVELVGRAGANLTHRSLQLLRFLARCHEVGIQTESVPREVDRRGLVSAASADTEDGGSPLLRVLRMSLVTCYDGCRL